MVKHRGFITGLGTAPNALADERPAAELLTTSDMVKVGLAGSIRSYRLATSDDQVKALEAIDYNGQPAGYASEPGEAVNYVENHDNQTLYDINVFKLPLATTTAERARVQRGAPPYRRWCSLTRPGRRGGRGLGLRWPEKRCVSGRRAISRKAAK